MIGLATAQSSCIASAVSPCFAPTYDDAILYVHYRDRVTLIYYIARIDILPQSASPFSFVKRAAFSGPIYERYMGLTSSIICDRENVFVFSEPTELVSRLFIPLPVVFPYGVQLDGDLNFRRIFGLLASDAVRLQAPSGILAAFSSFIGGHPGCCYAQFYRTLRPAANDEEYQSVTRFSILDAPVYGTFISSSTGAPFDILAPAFTTATTPTPYIIPGKPWRKYQGIPAGDNGVVHLFGVEQRTFRPGENQPIGTRAFTSLARGGTGLRFYGYKEDTTAAGVELTINDAYGNQVAKVSGRDAVRSIVGATDNNFIIRGIGGI